MRTRSQKLASENAGALPSPPQQLPAVQKRTRAPRKKASPAQQEPSIAVEGSKDLNSEASTSSLIPSVHPVQTRSRTKWRAPATRLPAQTRSRRVRAPPKPSVAPATQTLTSPGPKVPQALIHIWVDIAAEDLASAQPVNDPNILMAVPADVIPNLLKFIASNKTSPRPNKLTLSAVTTTISTSPSSNKRKLPVDADPPPVAQRARIEPTRPPVRPKVRRAFGPDGLAEPRLVPTQSTPIDHYEPSDTIPDTKFFKRVDRYGPNGNLQLGLVPVSISSEEGSNALYQPSRPVSPPLENQSVTEENGPATEQPEERASSDHGPTSVIIDESGTTGNPSIETPIAPPLPPEQGPAPETPRGSIWGLGTLMNTARRYLPALNRRVEPMAPVPENSVIAPSSMNANVSSPLPGVVPRDAPTDPNQNDQSPVTFNAPATTTLTATDSREHRERQERRRRRKHREHQQNTSQKKAKRTRNRPQSEGRKQAEQSSLRTQSHSKEAQAQEDFRREAEMASTPGTKRKRLPSPDTIPNPRGCSYGMDLDYFGYDSSDEDEVDNTPTKPRPAKSRRISMPDSSDGPVVGAPENARPYSGVLFAESGPSYHGGNAFSEVKAADRAMRMASKTMANESQRQAYLSKTSSGSGQRAPPATPISNRTGSFKVPSPSDSDSDPDESPRENSLSGMKKSSSEGEGVPQQVVAPTTTTAATSTGKSPEPWNKSPPPRPTPSHKTLPSAPKLKGSEPLASSSLNTISSNSGSSSSGSRLTAHHPAPLPVERSTDSEALRKVREKALQHKPRKPSTLSQSSRLNSSPLGDSGEEVNGSTAQVIATAPKNTGRHEIPAVQDTKSRGASNVDEAPKYTGHNKVAAIQAGTSFTGASNVDQAQKYTGRNEVAAIQAVTNSTGASNVEDAQKHTGRKEVADIQVDTNLPGASNVDEAQKYTARDEGHKEVAAIQADKTLTGASNVDGDHSDNKQPVSAPRPPKSFNAYEEYCPSMHAEVADLLAEEDIDVNVVGGVFKVGVTDFTTDAKGKGKELAGPTITAAPSGRSDTPIPVKKCVGEPEIMNYIDSKWTQADHQLAVTVFDKLYKDYAAKEMAEEEAKTASITGVAV
ncbi:hypothetical protein MMC22_001042 [Lobaria immixta]|nr:hypothetical protein [Lobaria immixta]